jgi:nicotinamide riboside kinase
MARGYAAGMKRVCLTGVESTGKSTIAPLLAERFGGVVMPEYGREWAETRGLDFRPEALRSIAADHVEHRAAIAAAGPSLIIEDTDIVMTAAWGQMLHDERDPVLAAMPADADLYLLFAPDTTWVDDGTRQFGGYERARFHAMVVNELKLRGIKPVLVGGDWASRLKKASVAIEKLLT